jgi:poly(A) polymerase
MSESNPEAARDLAVDVVQRLRAAGYQSLWAGGCVRDLLLGKEPKDYDVATNATPDDVREVFGKRRTIAIGAAFGVITVIGSKQSGNIEVATFRRDSTYSDGRHPDSVSYSSAEEDAQRRDLTINGLFYDPLAEEVIDYVGGKQDLQDRIVRAIGDADQRINEDKLRMLRVIRFTATYCFSLEEHTLGAVQRHASEIDVVSAERIAAEMRRMLVHPQRAGAARLLRESGLLVEILPESADTFSASRKDDGKDLAWNRTLIMLAALDSPAFPLALAALILEICWQINRDTGEAPKNVAQGIARRWKLSNDEVRMASWLVEHVGQLKDASELPWPKLQRILIHSNAAELVDLAEAVAKANDGNQDGVEYCRQRLAWPAERLNPSPLIDGDILKAAGIKPGPAFRQLLELTRDAQLEGKIADEASALEFARSLNERL